MQLNTMFAYALLVVPSTASPLMIVGLISVSQALIPCLTLAEVSRCCPNSSVGVAFGIIEVLDSVANLLGNIAFGFMYNATGSYTAGMLGLFIISIIGFVILLYLAVLEWRRREQLDEFARYRSGVILPSGSTTSLDRRRRSFLVQSEQPYIAI